MELYQIYLILIFLLIVTLVVTVLGLLTYSGLLHKVDIKVGKPPIDGVSIAYRYATGSYSNCGAIFTELMALCPDLKCLGIYYDDPKKVAAKNLRYAVAAILPQDETKAAIVKKLLKHDFKPFDLPAVESAITSEFPFTTMLSVYLAVKNVYPKLGEFVMYKQLSPHPFLEIYDGEVIKFMGPLEKQAGFYVPESQGPKEEEEEKGQGEKVESDKDK